MASTYKGNEPNNTSTTPGSDLSTSLGKSVSGNTTAPNIKGQSAKGKDTNPYIANVNQAAQSPALQFNAGNYDNITSAQNYLNNVIANKPGSYQSKYTGQLNKLYTDLMNRGPMQYDLNGDALYDQYRQRYTQQGLTSMRDTMGQAAAQTGGYGSSYAQTAGQSAYNQYMAQLANVVPELQAKAQERYDRETQDMTNRYNLAYQADQSDYARHRDSVTDWQNERNYAAGRYDTEYNRSYNEFSGQMNIGMNAVNAQRTQEQSDRQNAQSLVTTMIGAGVMPSEALLTQAGYSAADVKSLIKKK